MKLTKKKAKVAFPPKADPLRAGKNGLSIVLAFILLGNAVQPLQVLAASQQGSTEALSALEPEKPVETVQSVLLQICQNHGYDETCAKHLLGMVMVESKGVATALGDHGHAHGWFQINNTYNPKVSIGCAQDLTCSAEWTLTRLETKHYSKDFYSAIWSHNGYGINKSYVPKVLSLGKTQWSTPVPLVTAEQRALALK